MSWSSEDSDVVPVQAYVLASSPHLRDARPRLTISFHLSRLTSCSASRPHDFSAIGSGFDTSPSSSWSNPGPVASRAAQGQDGLVFGAAM